MADAWFSPEYAEQVFRAAVDTINRWQAQLAASGQGSLFNPVAPPEEVRKAYAAMEAARPILEWNTFQGNLDTPTSVAVPRFEEFVRQEAARRLSEGQVPQFTDEDLLGLYTGDLLNRFGGAATNRERFENEVNLRIASELARARMENALDQFGLRQSGYEIRPTGALGAPLIWGPSSTEGRLVRSLLSPRFFNPNEIELMRSQPQAFGNWNAVRNWVQNYDQSRETAQNAFNAPGSMSGLSQSTAAFQRKPRFAGTTNWLLYRGG